MNIIISGALGAMGRVVAANAATYGLTVLAGVDRTESDALPYPVFSSFDRCPMADAIIDFSHPSALPNLLAYSVQSKTPCVIATTGLSPEDLQSIHTAAQQTAIFFTFNMSLGINLMVSLLKKAASVLGEGFDIEVIEKHHNQKVDAPSGTAVMLVDALKQALPYPVEPVYDRHNIRQKRSSNEIGLHAIRGGTIVGEHEVLFAGLDEVISIKHEAHSKGVFAIGALKAAQFIAGRQPGLYNMEDLLA